MRPPDKIIAAVDFCFVSFIFYDSARLFKATCLHLVKINYRRQVVFELFINIFVTIVDQSRCIFHMPRIDILSCLTDS